MRILHTADWHLGRALEGRSRQEEQEAFMDELATIVREEKIDLVLMAGDAYDSVNPPSAAEKLFYDGISRLADGGKCHVMIIAGNHDHPERLAASAPIALRQGITLLGLPVPQMQSIDISRTGERAKVFALPYPSESRLRELLVEEVDEEGLRSAYSERIAALMNQQRSEFSAKSVNLIMSHLYVLGGAETESERPIQVGGAYTVDTSALCIGAQYVALGHLHRPQNMKASSPSSPIRYSGSPLAYSFSEAGQAKSVTVLDIKPGEPAVMTEIFLASGRPLVRWRASEGIAQVYHWLEEGKDSRAWIDLELHVNDALTIEQIHHLRKQHAGIVQIRPIYPEMQKESLESQSSLPIDELFRRFYTRQTGGAEPDQPLVELFMELLQEGSEQDSRKEDGE